jgi:signal transduction histidine kinase
VLKSNPEEEQMHMALKTRKVKDIVEELYATYNVVIPDRLEYNIVRGPEDVYVDVNRSSMMQVMSNLVNNAVKFTKEGSITMGWQCTDDKAIIFLEDTGIGIPEEKQELIFDRYYKESSSTAGAGIGLSLCRRLVENMHGKIQVKSEVGKGSRFELVFKKTE